VDMLRRADIEVASVSITGSREIHGSHNIDFFADMTFEEADMDAFDGAVLPGGAVGTANLGAHEGVAETVRRFADNGKLVAAICATCHPGWEEKLCGAVACEETAVTDENIITSRGMGTSIDFSLAIIAKLADEQTVAKVRKGIVY